MSDFVNTGWSIFVIVIVVAGLLFCLFILLVASKRKVMANDNTTGHVWDEDLQELNNPLPRWWMWLFVITVVFSAIYLALYPGLGTVPGTLKWTSAGQWQAEQAKANLAMAPVYAKFSAMSAADLAKDPQAMGIGERLFINNCAQCHGSDAHGSKGFPNLTDSDWLGGSGPDYIAKTITGGRTGMMHRWPLRWAALTTCATWPTTCSACPAVPTTIWQRNWANQNFPPAPLATARKAKAPRRWARPI